MGRKDGGIYINPKKFGGMTKPCMKEMISFLSCLVASRSSGSSDDNKCVRQKQQMSACLDAQSGKKRNALGSINYHLQRLNRARK